MAKNKSSQSFEKALKELESLVEKMESGDTSLEQGLEWFEEGMRLVKTCRNQLEDAEQKVQSLIKDSEGKLELENLE
ncbi:MAG: exodeoxyribonuclease VII small subunit [Candidatus Neomarinimicrobiota bacterium]|nr:exodeoxyribonuclease VII small subunit [Candidatus Neomarinimicrobiota bacterium]MEC7848474.1 exodeoxyribonuclease VII small subunit [Candidatus Neomarinimicrobiota bacterium]|tara:strand:+ start:6223 stop:6453 length:231 start_codon:yes stop_codon:yes gene_type:complete